MTCSLCIITCSLCVMTGSLCIMTCLLCIMTCLLCIMTCLQRITTCSLCIITGLLCIMTCSLCVMTCSLCIMIHCRTSGLDVKSYCYYDPSNCGFDFKGAMEDISVRYLYTSYHICNSSVNETYGSWIGFFLFA